MESIGIKLADGSFYPILKDGKPAQKKLSLTTVKDNQTSVHVDVYRSKTGSMEDAQYVDTLEIDNLNPHVNGEPSIDLDLTIDENGELHADMADPETGYQVARSLKPTAVSAEPGSGASDVTLAESEDFGTTDKLTGDDAIPIDETSPLPDIVEDDVDTPEPSGDASFAEPETLPDISEEDFGTTDKLTGDDAIPIDETSPLPDIVEDDVETPEPSGDASFAEPETLPDISEEDFGTTGDVESLPDIPEEPLPEDTKKFEEIFNAPVPGSEKEEPAEEADPSFEEILNTISGDAPASTATDDNPYAITDAEVNGLGNADASEEAEMEAAAAAMRKIEADEAPSADDESFGETLEPVDGGETLIADEPLEEIPAERALPSASEESDIVEPMTLEDLPDFEEVSDSGEITDGVEDFPSDATGLSDDMMPDFGRDANQSADSADTSDDFSESVTKSSADAEEFNTPDFDMPDFGSTADASTAATSDDDFSLPDFSSTTDASTPATSDDDFSLPDFSSTADTSASSVDDFTMPDFGSTTDTSTPATSDDDFSLPDLSNTADTSASSVDDFAMPDFGSTSADDDEDPYSLPDLPEFKFNDDETSRLFASDSFSGSDYNTSESSPDFGDFDLPDFTPTSAVREKANLTFDEPDFGSASTSNSYSTSQFDFGGLYDKETMEGKSSDAFDDSNRKNRVPMIICMVCAAICVLCLLFLFLIPTKLNILKRLDTNIAQTDAAATETSAETGKDVAQAPAGTDGAEQSDKPTTVQINVTDSKPERPEPVPAKENEIVVATVPSQVIPEPPMKNVKKIPDYKYTVVWGDTLWDIANAYYKNPWRYTYLAEYNHLRNPNLITAGSVILIPAE